MQIDWNKPWYVHVKDIILTLILNLIGIAAFGMLLVWMDQIF